MMLILFSLPPTVRNDEKLGVHRRSRSSKNRLAASPSCTSSSFCGMAGKGRLWSKSGCRTGTRRLCSASQIQPTKPDKVTLTALGSFRPVVLWINSATCHWHNKSAFVVDCQHISVFYQLFPIASFPNATILSLPAIAAEPKKLHSV